MDARERIDRSVTWNEHVACWRAASVAVQLTVVLPRGKDPPDCGEHETRTGGIPPFRAGVGYGTGLTLPVTASVKFEGQEISGGPKPAGGGVVG